VPRLHDVDGRWTITSIQNWLTDGLLKKTEALDENSFPLPICPPAIHANYAGTKKGATGYQISLTHSFMASQKQEMCLLGMKTCNKFYSPAQDVKEIAIFKLKLSKISSLHSILSRPVCFCPQTRK
jgi:hypothetical protein